METATAIRDRFTRHGLQLIRVANGLMQAADADMQRLGRSLRRALADYDPSMTQRELRALLAEVDATITRAFSRMSAANVATLHELIDVEAGFATRAAGLRHGPSRTALARTHTELSVYGAPIRANWEQQASTLRWQLSATIRNARATNLEPSMLRSQILGSRGSSGLIDTATRKARALADAGIQSARQSAHHAAFKAPGSGINALQWHSVLDAKLCPECAARSGHLYDLDYQPIAKGTPPMGGTPPVHFFCRCMLLPMRFENGPPKDGGPGPERFENWLERQSREAQEDILGKGRTDLWREGKITLADLIGQNGRVLTLSELRRGLP